MVENLEEKTLKKLNARLLASQHLTVKASGHSPLVSISDAVCGINSQNFRDSFLSYWARAGSFSDDALNKLLKPRGELARTWTVRGTVHTFPAKDYYTHVFGSPRNRILSRHDTYAKQLGLPDRDDRIDLLYMPLLDEIRGETVTSNFIGGFITERLVKHGFKGMMKLNRGWTSQAKYGPVWKGLTEMSYLGLIVSAGRNGSESLWMSTSHWMKTRDRDPEPDECAVKLIRSYIETYGPVSFSDIVYWSGHRKRDAMNAINDLRNDLYEEHLEGSDETYYSFDGHQRDFPEPPRAVVLPRFDSIMMGHEDKSRFMDPAFRDRVFAPAGIINPTVLVDGFVSGTWRREKVKKGLKIIVSAFKDIDNEARKALDERFSEMGDYLKTDVAVSFN